MLVLGTTLANLSSIAVSLLVVRMLGKAEVGTLMALIMIYQTAALVLTSGFPHSVMYHVTSHQGAERRAVVLRMCQILLALGGVAAILLALAGLLGDYVLDRVSLARVDGDERVSLRPLLLFALLPLGDVPGRLLPNLLVAEGRAKTVSLLNISRAISNSLAILVPIALGYGVWVVTACYVAVGLLHSAVLPVMFHALYGKLPRVPAPVTRRELFRFAVPLGTTDVIALLNQQVDRYLILFFFPASAFAAYQAGAWQIPIVTDIPYAVGSAYAPKFVELVKAGQPRAALELWQRSAVKVSLIIVPVTCYFMLVADDMVRVLFTDKYADAGPVLRCYASLGLLRIAAYGPLITCAGKPHYVMRAAWWSFLSNLVLSIALLYAIGFLGPALATAISYWFMIAAYCRYIGLAIGVRGTEVLPLRGYLPVLGVSIVAVACAYPVDWLGLPVGSRLLVKAAVALVVYAGLGSVTGIIARSDWKFAFDWLRLKVAR